MTTRKDPRTLAVSRPLYGFAEVDRLAGVTRGTARRWLLGYAYQDPRGTRVRRPPVTPTRGAREAASFHDLVEVVAIGRFREAGLSLSEIRRVVAACTEIWGTRRPLVTLRFKTDGREVFVDRAEALVEVGKRKRAQAWHELLEPYLQELDYDAHNVARRWWPMGRQAPIVIDPEYGFGLPVVHGSGVRTEIVMERFRAGDFREQIGDDFNLTPEEVERALQFEARRVPRAA